MVGVCRRECPFDMSEDLGVEEVGIALDRGVDSPEPLIAEIRRGVEESSEAALAGPLLPDEGDILDTAGATGIKVAGLAEGLRQDGSKFVGLVLDLQSIQF